MLPIFFFFSFLFCVVVPNSKHILIELISVSILTYRLSVGLYFCNFVVVWFKQIGFISSLLIIVIMLNHTENDENNIISYETVASDIQSYLGIYKHK